MIAPKDIYEKYGMCDVPECYNAYSGLVRIVGGGKSMWDDLKKSPQGHTISVNLAGVVLPFPVEHLFSWHQKQISAIKSFRQAEWVDCKALVHSIKPFDKVDHVWQFQGDKSFSGLSAVDLAYLLGYRKIVLVGVPMDNSGYFYKDSDMLNPDLCDNQRLNEIGRVREQYGDCVKSMSGRTRDVLGLPPQEFYDN